MRVDAVIRTLYINRDRHASTRLGDLMLRYLAFLSGAGEFGAGAWAEFFTITKEAP